MLKIVDPLNERDLYEYFRRISQDIPFYFPVDYDLWYKCMFKDCTEDGRPLFNELETYLYYEGEILKGFIQFGISSFVFDAKKENEKDFNNHYAIIRNIHYSRDSKNPEKMLEMAYHYFDNKNSKEIDAFFHYFGMSCYARHGKLHESAFYIEELLLKHSFKKVHENVYFTKDLTTGNQDYHPDISYELHKAGADREKILFKVNNEQIGYCLLSFLQDNICYLYYFEIEEKFRGQGLGTRCLNNMFCILNERHIQKLDLDTTDTNYNAQRLYIKIGFHRKGITRSYRKLQ
jgi:ribosomal protein S18 acetylase RimI-like enzyme